MPDHVHPSHPSSFLRNSLASRNGELSRDVSPLHSSILQRPFSTATGSGSPQIARQRTLQHTDLQYQDNPLRSVVASNAFSNGSPKIPVAPQDYTDTHAMFFSLTTRATLLDKK